jgi:hypothetical protein
MLLRWKTLNTCVLWKILLLVKKYTYEESTSETESARIAVYGNMATVSGHGSLRLGNLLHNSHCKQKCSNMATHVTWKHSLWRYSTSHFSEIGVNGGRNYPDCGTKADQAEGRLRMLKAKNKKLWKALGTKDSDITRSHIIHPHDPYHYTTSPAKSAIWPTSFCLTPTHTGDSQLWKKTWTNFNIF